MGNIAFQGSILILVTAQYGWKCFVIALFQGCFDSFETTVEIYSRFELETRGELGIIGAFCHPHRTGFYFAMILNSRSGHVDTRLNGSFGGVPGIAGVVIKP